MSCSGRCAARTASIPSCQAGEFGEPLAIFGLEIKRGSRAGEPEALSVQVENLADKPIWAYVLRITDESTGASWEMEDVLTAA